MTLRNLALILPLLLAASVAFAQYRPPIIDPNAKPSNVGVPILKDVRVDQRLDNQVPLDLKFRDEAGHEVQLKDYAGKRPIVLSLVYFGCPMLCTQVLNGLVQSLKMVPMTPGNEFEVLTVSFDPREKPELAAEKKASYMKNYNRPGAEAGWHFLTGNQPEITALADAVGFRYVYDEKFKQFAHPSCIFLLTPDLKVSRYFFNIEYSPNDMRLGLLEASKGKIGPTLTDRVALFCFHYDPTAGKYTMTLFHVMQAAGLATLAVMGSFVGLMIRRDMRVNRALKAAEEAG